MDIIKYFAVIFRFFYEQMSPNDSDYLAPLVGYVFFALPALTIGLLIILVNSLFKFLIKLDNKFNNKFNR